jgi:hypothetical protein
MSKKINVTLCVEGDRVKWVDHGDGQKRHIDGYYLVTGVSVPYTDDPNSPTYETLFRDEPANKPNRLTTAFMVERAITCGAIGACIALLCKAAFKR